MLRQKDLLLEQFRNRCVSDIGVDILTALAAVDGALIVDRTGKLITFGTILRVPGRRAAKEDEGARTTAARFASKFGLAIAVSADGPVSAYHRGKETLTQFRLNRASYAISIQCISAKRRPRNG